MSPHLPSLSQSHYPWISSPLIACAPMLRISLSRLAVSVSQAGGFGFLNAGFDASTLEAELAKASELLELESASPPSPIKAADDDADGDNVLPIGVGFLNWGANLEESLKVLEKRKVAAVWFYAPYSMSDLKPWSEGIRRVSRGKTRVWVQVGSVELALQAVEVCAPDVIVVQGSDAGGHGLVNGAGIITLLPEVIDAFEERGITGIPVIAGGGIVDGRGVAACLNLGAAGWVMGTRFLVSREAEVMDGYRREVLRARDGGISTVRTTVYDHARGFHQWPKEYNGRGVVNKSYEDAVAGMDTEENERLYQEALKLGDRGWGPEGRLCTYAGTGVGLVKEIMSAGNIVKEVRADAVAVIKETATRFG